jgi:hypothetical protein
MQDKPPNKDNKIKTDESCKQSELTSLLHDRGHISSTQGTPSSNTVPSKYNSDPFILRFGIDSLYLSYQGELSEEGENKLSDLKDLAQSENPKEQDKAQLSIGDHLFEVLDKGQKPFAFVLVDNWFRISFSRRSSKSMPLAYIQVSSELLTFHPIEEIIRDLEFVINSLSSKVSKPNVSRVDLFVDFTTNHDLDAINIYHWVTRTTLFDKHYIRPHFTGWSIGYGGDISARLYDKVLEIKKSGKDYLFPIWKEAGWNEEQHVWRLEFQYMREFLNQVESVPFDKFITNQGPLWRFASTEWLRLSIPNPKDSNNSRWPTNPLWDALSQISWKDNPDKLLKRIRKQRIPCDDILYRHGMAGLTSFMALHGITDLYEGVKQFIKHAKRFHDSHGRFTDETFLSYIQKKVKEKGRHFNTIDNQDKKDKKTLKKEAISYRTKKDGE